MSGHSPEGARGEGEKKEEERRGEEEKREEDGREGEARMQPAVNPHERLLRTTGRLILIKNFKRFICGIRNFVLPLQTQFGAVA